MAVPSADLPSEMWQHVFSFLPVEAAFAFVFSSHSFSFFLTSRIDASALGSQAESSNSEVPLLFRDSLALNVTRLLSSVRTVCKLWADCAPKSREHIGELTFLRMLPKNPAKWSWNDPTWIARTAEGFILRALPRFANLRSIDCSPADSSHWASLLSGGPAAFDAVMSKLTRLESFRFPIGLGLRGKSPNLGQYLASLGRGHLTLLQDLQDPLRPVAINMSPKFISDIATMTQLRSLHLPAETTTITNTPSQTIQMLTSLSALEDLRLCFHSSKTETIGISAADINLISKSFPRLRSLTVHAELSPFEPVMKGLLHRAFLPTLQDLSKTGLWFCDLRLRMIPDRSAFDQGFPESYQAKLKNVSMIELAVISGNVRALAFVLDTMSKMDRVVRGLASAAFKKEIQFEMLLALASCSSMDMWNMLTTNHTWSSKLIREAVVTFPFTNAEQDVLLTLLTTGIYAWRLAVCGVYDSQHPQSRLPHAVLQEHYLSLFHSASLAERERASAKETIAATEHLIKQTAVSLTRFGMIPEKLPDLLSPGNLEDYFLECVHMGAEAHSSVLTQKGIDGLSKLQVNISKQINAPRGSDGMTPLQRFFAPCVRYRVGFKRTLPSQLVTTLLTNGADVNVRTLEGFTLIDLAVFTRTDDEATEVKRLNCLHSVVKRVSSSFFADSAQKPMQVCILLDEIAYYAHGILADLLPLLPQSIFAQYGEPSKYFEALRKPEVKSLPFYPAALSFVRKTMSKSRPKVSVEATLGQVIRTKDLALWNEVTAALNVEPTAPVLVPLMKTVADYSATEIGAHLVKQGVKPALDTTLQVIRHHISSDMIKIFADAFKLTDDAANDTHFLVSLPFDDSILKHGVQKLSLKLPLRMIAVASGNLAAFRSLRSYISADWVSSDEPCLSVLHLAPHGAMVENVLTHFPDLNVNVLDAKQRSVFKFWSTYLSPNAFSELTVAVFNHVGPSRVVDFGPKGELFLELPFNPSISDFLRRYFNSHWTSAATTLCSAILCTKRREFANLFIDSIAELKMLGVKQDLSNADWALVLSTLIATRDSRNLKKILSIPAAKSAARETETLLCKLFSNLTPDSFDAVSECYEALLDSDSVVGSMYGAKDVSGQTPLSLLEKATNLCQNGRYDAVVAKVRETRSQNKVVPPSMFSAAPTPFAVSSPSFAAPSSASFSTITSSPFKAPSSASPFSTPDASKPFGAKSPFSTPVQGAFEAPSASVGANAPQFSANSPFSSPFGASAAGNFDNSALSNPFASPTNKKTTTTAAFTAPDQTPASSSDIRPFVFGQGK